MSSKSIENILTQNELQLIGISKHDYRGCFWFKPSIMLQLKKNPNQTIERVTIHRARTIKGVRREWKKRIIAQERKVHFLDLCHH
jgi:hypothetical protein